MSEQLVEKIYELLEEVMDPELGIDIVNLGLVYDVKINEDKDVEIAMTMTSMGCPMAPQIMSEAHMKLSLGLPELRNIDIQIVWSPAWSKEKMSRYAKIALGVRD